MPSYQAERDEPTTSTSGTVADPRRGGPTALRIALGAELRRLREASQITPAQAADTIRATQSKISRLERGRSAARHRDVADLSPPGTQRPETWWHTNSRLANKPELIRSG
ncbi:MAG: helix-turn-helix domain-containing protein [Streptosporangiaceae bacterium]|nr:helix-turn-helix domain-containing protein [Streptosporangiaceae bacterium]